MTETEQEIFQRIHKQTQEMLKSTRKMIQITEAMLKNISTHQKKELDELEALVIKNREHIRDADSFLQEIARIRSEG